MRPSKRFSADIKESTWNDIVGALSMGQFDRLVELLHLLPSVQTQQLKGYRVADAIIVPPDCVRLHLEKPNKTISLDLYVGEDKSFWDVPPRELYHL